MGTKATTTTTTTAPASAPATTRRTARRDHRDRIAAAAERLRRALADKPGFGSATSSSTTVLGDGLRCTSTERSMCIESDLAPALGGERSAPSPGMHVRAALGACLAMRYQMLAAERGVELTSLRITVEEHSELRGLLCDDAGAPPGATALRYRVEIESPADDREIEELVEAGDRLSPVLDDLSRPRSIEHTLSIVHGTG